MKSLKNNFLLIALLSISYVLPSCAQTEHTEEVTADITAAQMEGRKAARDYLIKEWNDTAELQNKLLETKAIQSKYIIEGKPKCAEAFDSAFISTIRAVKPDLARSISKKE